VLKSALNDTVHWVFSGRGETASAGVVSKNLVIQHVVLDHRSGEQALGQLLENVSL